MNNNKTPAQLYAERSKCMQDALQLEQPDHIPIMLPMSYMLAEIGGITNQELHENPEKAQQLLEKAALEYQPDSILGLMPSDPSPHLILGERTTVWPGHGIGPDAQFQFVENEYMKAEDYDDFLADPADWAVRVYLPRTYSALEGFSLMPPLGMFLYSPYGLLNIGTFASPPLAASFQVFARAVQAATDNAVLMMKNMERMTALGFPPSFIAGSSIEAPFDLMSDTLRGMRGAMLDMFQRPDKLLAAEEKVTRFQLEHAISFSQATGMRNCFLPLHRGSDGFMSLKQFEEFYWPQLKHVLIILVNHGITPVVFYEGCWDQRLEYLAELPRGKTVGWFQSSDIFKVKEIIGDTMCIIGGMPNSMLKTATNKEVRKYTRKVCRIVGKNGGFIMCTGAIEMSGSRPDLVKAWVEATREYGEY